MATPRYAYRLGWRSLKRVVPNLSEAQAKELARNLGQAMVDFDITSRRRATMFVAQLAHESAGYRAREEFSSGEQYENRKDLGNIHPGDGKRFKGRSYIQITGRNNYRALPHWDHINFENHPTSLAKPKYAAKAAAWWWKNHGCNELADTGDFVAVTRRINGGTNGLADRKSYYRRARLVAPFLIPKRRKP